MSEPELWNELGNLYFMMEAYEPAIYAYTRSIDLDHEFGRPYSNLALAYVQRGKFTEAIDLYKKSIDLLGDEGEKAVTWNRLGDVYRQLKDYNNAFFAYQRADEISPLLSEARERPAGDPADPLALSALPLNLESLTAELDPAEFDFSTGLDPADESVPPPVEDILSWPEDESAPIEGPDVQEISEPLQETRVFSFKELLQGGPDDWIAVPAPDPDGMMVNAWHLENPPEKSNEENAEVLAITQDLSPTDSPAVVPASLDESPQRAAEPTPQAVEVLTVQDDPAPILLPSRINESAEDLQAGTQDVTETGVVQYTQVEYPPADLTDHEREAIENDIAKFKKVVQINPRNAFAWDTLGNLYKSAGRYKEAILSYQQALSVDSTRASWYYHLGLVYAAERRTEEAIAAFQKVVEIDPKYSVAHATLGGYYRKMGLDDLAQLHIDRALSNPLQDENEYNRACLEAICGNTDRALEFLRAALGKKQTYLEWARRDPDLDFIRGDPRFQSLLSTYSQKDNPA
jgi:tetratricopeptide (TPR) repeat protein